MKIMAQPWTEVKLSTRSQVMLFACVIGVGVLGFIAVSSDLFISKGSSKTPALLTVKQNDEKGSDKAIAINTNLVTSYYPYIPGDVNGDDRVIGSDVTYLVNYFHGRSAPVYSVETESGIFYPAADVNGDCEVSSSDVTYLVNYLKGGAELEYCPDFPPIGMNAAPTQGNPIITPENPNSSDSLTCQSQNVDDTDDESVTTVYNWIKDGSSL